MSLEFLLVSFPEEREVLANGIVVGFTNHPLMLSSNYYVITLRDTETRPAEQEALLTGTSVVRPKVLRFEPA
jgi:hypothetical protein